LNSDPLETTKEPDHMSVDISFFTDPPPVDPESLPGLPKASKVHVFTEKHLKRVAKEMALGMKELDRMNRLPPMNPAERREQRRLQQIERRNAKALSEVVL
jgi:hypothetical protein